MLVHLNRNKVYLYEELSNLNLIPEDLTRTLVKLYSRIRVLCKSGRKNCVYFCKLWNLISVLIEDKFLESAIQEGFLYLFVELFHNFTDFITNDKTFKVNKRSWNLFIVFEFLNLRSKNL